MEKNLARIPQNSLGLGCPLALSLGGFFVVVVLPLPFDSILSPTPSLQAPLPYLSL